MVADLSQELSYELISGDSSLVIGAGTQYIVDDLDISPGEIRVNDTAAPREDGVNFGRDRFGGQLITFSIIINEPPYVVEPYPIGKARFDVPGPLEPYAALRRAWRADAVRNTSGAVSTLRMRRGGRVRRVFGRPRRAVPAPEKARAGWISVECEFQCKDDLFYEDFEHSNQVTIVPPEAGGYLTPVLDPWVSIGTSFAPGVVHIGGDDPAWLCFKINGPIVRPVVEVVGHWAIGLNLSLRDGEWVGIDARPWSRGIRSIYGANLGGVLVPGSPRLSDVRLNPGSYEIVLRGTDETGTASMSVAWRESYLSQ